MQITPAKHHFTLCSFVPGQQMGIFCLTNIVLEFSDLFDDNLVKTNILTCKFSFKTPSLFTDMFQNHHLQNQDELQLKTTL